MPRFLVFPGQYLMEIISIRAYKNHNLYSCRPVLRARIRLGCWAGKLSSDYPSFVERLLKLLPGLHEHHCSRGYTGGFVERLREGTYFGHVIEHVAIELQQLAGLDVNYGKTLETEKEEVYDIILAYSVKESAEEAVRQAAELVSYLLSGDFFNLRKKVDKIKFLADTYGLGPSTQAVIKAARQRDIPVMRLSCGSLLQLGYGINQKRVMATMTGNTSSVAVDIAGDKVLTKKVLSEAGIPVPAGGVVKNLAEAIRLAVSLGPPVAIKPYNGNQGKGVALNISKTSEIQTAFQLAQAYSSQVIIEKYITGRHYRLLIVNDCLVAVAERIPAHVRGDGIHTVHQLVVITNRNPRRGNEHEKPLTKISIDPMVLLVLAKQGLSLDYCPAAGETVFLRQDANLSTGGTSKDVTDLVHPQNRLLAEWAVRQVGLDVAGVDMVLEDIAVPLKEGNGAIIEINAAPGIRMHEHPSEGKPRRVAKKIIKGMFPTGKTNGRIPIVSITGTNGKTTVARLIAYVLGLKGKTVGLASTDGIYIKGEKMVAGDNAGPDSASAVLRDPRVEAAVLETARGGIIRCGLGYDRADVVVVTNISDDHLGKDGIWSLDDLVRVKSLVVEAVPQNGTVVLNADDFRVMKMKEHTRAENILFSLSPENVLIRRHLSGGGKAVVVNRSKVWLATADRMLELIPVSKIPITFQGSAVYNLQNVLAAVGAVWAMDVPFDQICEGLRHFGVSWEDNPGRLTFQEVQGIKIIIDYGHNAAAYEQVLSFCRKLNPSRLIGIIGVPGDRRDESIRQVGMVAGEGLAQVYIKEDKNLRGRRPGEVAELLKEGVLSAGLREERVKIIIKEETALKKAVETAKQGDLIVIFYENFETVMQCITCLKKNIISRVALVEQG